MTIHQAIPAIMAEIGSIGKDRKNAQQGYAYRGIEDFYNSIQPLLVKYKVFSVPTVLDQKREERPSKSGGILFSSIFTIAYDFFAEDGSSVRAIVVGEGMDSGDKSSNKAMSVAHKYALAQIFAVPTKEMVDPEVDSPEPAPRPSNTANVETLKQAVRDAKAITSPPKAPADEKDNPVAEYQALEAECVRLSHLLGSDTVTSVREQIASWREKYRTGDITPYIEKLKGLKTELSEKVADRGEL